MKITNDLVITVENQNNYKNLVECGNLILSENAKLDAPVLATTGNIYLSENAKLDCKLTKKLNYRSVDRTMFVIESEKTSKGIKILTGYVLVKFTNKVVEKRVCFVAEKDGYFAHGETVKKAICDLQFKIVAEKLKKDPIKADTMITPMYYRIVTGACEFGTKQWIEQNKLTDLEEMRADELFKILSKTNPYGFERFKQLVNF